MSMIGSNIEIIAFDLGGVLAEVDWVPLKALHEQEAFVENAFFVQNDYQAFSKGELNAQDYFKGVAAILKRDPITVQNTWCGIVKGHAAAKSILESLNKPFVLWSNINSHHLNVLIKDLALSQSVIDKSAFSFIEGFLKPDPQFYHRGLEKIGRPAHQVLFIDDQQKNIEVALKMGLEALHLPHIGQLKEILIPFLTSK